MAEGENDAQLARETATDPVAREALARRLGPRVRRLSASLLRSPHDAEDAAQAALLDIVRAAPSFRGECSLESWADRIAVRTAIRVARTRRLASVRSSAEVELDELPAAPLSDAAEALPRSILAYLAELPEVRRTVLVLRHALGCSIQEIAEHTGVSPEHGEGPPARGARRRPAHGPARARARKEAAMSDPCARWITLEDRVALGETLEPHDAGFHHAHPASCPECGREAEVWAELGALLDGPAPAQRSLVVPRTRRRWKVGALAFAVSAAAAAGMALWAHAPRESAPPVIAQTSAAPDARLVLASPVAVDGRPSAPGRALAVGNLLDAHEASACMTLDSGVRACVERGGLVRVASLGASRRLELLRGRIVAELDPQPSGTSFGILTRDGSAIAVGTAFSVEVPDGPGPVVTRVLHGTVVVRSTAGEEQRVQDHQMTASHVVVPLPPNDEAHVRARLHGDPAPPTIALSALPPAPPASAHVVKTPGELLAEAREKRGRGDAAGAARAYRELVDAHAASPEGRAALVPLGELQLTDQAAPAAALASFDRYLLSGGPLDEEATFGRIRSLRALGRASEERAAIDAFLTRFTTSPLAAALRERRTALEAR